VTCARRVVTNPFLVFGQKEEIVNSWARLCSAN
jgi:hypothetical protein